MTGYGYSVRRKGHTHRWTEIIDTGFGHVRDRRFCNCGTTQVRTRFNGAAIRTQGTWRAA